jgi:hypothetical protein
MSKYVLGTKKVIAERQIVVEEREVELPIYDWDAIPDQIYAEATISVADITGIVVKDRGNLYFLHNNPAFSGSFPKQMFGYKYGWHFIKERLENGESDIRLRFPEAPSDFVLTPDPVPTTIDVAGYEGLVYSNGIQLGCQFVTKETVAEVLKLINEAIIVKPEN